SSRPRRTRRRSGGSTRPRRPAIPTSAGGRWPAPRRPAPTDGTRQRAATRRRLIDRSCGVHEDGTEPLPSLTRILLITDRPRGVDRLHGEWATSDSAHGVTPSGAARTDAELVGRVQADDLDAFEEFFARFRGPVYRTAYGLTGDPQAAEEVLQDAFVRAFQRRHTLRL